MPPSSSLRTLNVRMGKLFHAQLAKYPDPTDPDATTHVARQLLEDALREKASDIHLDGIASGLCVRFRIDGAMTDIAELSSEVGDQLLRYFKVNAGLNPTPTFAPEDAHFQFEVSTGLLDLRLACVPCGWGEKLTLRLLQKSRLVLKMTDLGLSEDDHKNVEQWLTESAGLFVVAGPVGSGKTTTLYALLHELHLVRKSITTIEDPIEYQVDKINQIQVDPKRGLTFATGLRSILRLDPDVIIVGEIRDSESASVAIEASNTGRVLLSTMHSRDAAGVITSLRNLDIRNDEIAAALSFVVAQRLVRKLCLQCRAEGRPSDADAAWLARIGRKVPASTWRASGCEACDGTGYQGRTGIFETRYFDEASYELIRGGIDEHGLRRHLASAGSPSLLESGLAKAAAGITDFAELRGAGGIALQTRPREKEASPKTE